MIRALAILLLAGGYAAVAAPVPKDAQARDAIVKQFGALTDPTKEAEFVTDGRKLTIRLPKPTPRNSYALKFPHTLREVRGDFDLRVKVTYDLPREVPPLGGGMCAAGGLLIWAGEQNHVLFQRHHQPCGLFDGTTRWDTAFCIEYNRGVKSQHHQNTIGVKDAAPVWLRLTRKEGVVATAYSFDGENWTDQQPGPMDLPEKVTVGVYALQTTGQPAAVTFEDFTVTPIEAPKKPKE